jgi:hypothetical protein
MSRLYGVLPLLGHHGVGRSLSHLVCGHCPLCPRCGLCVVSRPVCCVGGVFVSPPSGRMTANDENKSLVVHHLVATSVTWHLLPSERGELGRGGDCLPRLGTTPLPEVFTVPH